MPVTPVQSPKTCLNRLLAALVADPEVQGVFLGGSLARGSDDLVSDVDLWVESEDWNPARIGSLFVSGRTATLDNTPFFHGVSTHGVIVDLMFNRPHRQDYRKVELPAANPSS